MAASLSERRIAVVREVLRPVLVSIDRAGLTMASRKVERGHLTDWEAFALTLCLAVREVVELAIDDGDADERRDLRGLLRVADDVVFATRWPPGEWWLYLARTRHGRDTLDLVRHVGNEIDLGNMAGPDFLDQYGEVLRAGEQMMEAWELEQDVPGCVGMVVRHSV